MRKSKSSNRVGLLFGFVAGTERGFVRPFPLESDESVKCYRCDLRVEPAQGLLVSFQMQGEKAVAVDLATAQDLIDFPRQKGIVKKFLSRRKIGFISGMDGRDYSFRETDLQCAELYQYEQVQFIPVFSPKNNFYYAKFIETLTDQEPTNVESVAA